MSDNENKLVFARYEVPGESPVIVVGIPTAAWEYMRDGKTHHFDLTRAGVPVKLMLFGATTHDAAMATLREVVDMQGLKFVDARNEDFSIKFPKEPK